MRFVVYALLGLVGGSIGGGLVAYYGSEILSSLDLLDRRCLEGSCAFGSRVNALLGFILGTILGPLLGLWLVWVRHESQTPPSVQGR